MALSTISDRFHEFLMVEHKNKKKHCFLQWWIVLNGLCFEKCGNKCTGPAFSVIAKGCHIRFKGLPRQVHSSLALFLFLKASAAEANPHRFPPLIVKSGLAWLLRFGMSHLVQSLNLSFSHLILVTKWKWPG